LTKVSVEQPLEPDQLICDPHHHLWDHPSDRYLLEELRADIGQNRVVATVFVECMAGYRTTGPEALRPVGETELVERIAAESERTAKDGAVISGIVAFADLRSPDIENVLAAHETAGRGRFRGIRHASGWDANPAIRPAHTNPPPGLFGDPAFRAGLGALGRAGLSFDAWLYHPQLGELADLATAHEDVTIVLDHLGGPLGIGPYAGRRAAMLEEWRSGMAAVARCPNVVLKLGGIGMALFGLRWHERPVPPSSEELATAWGDEIRWCIETFGSERCMFESNFPVDKGSCDYTVLWNAFKRMTMDASATEKDNLFHRTATRVYRIDLPPATVAGSS
jgi:predicted TIM-barrel fold metal-dependent hydrolase